MRPRSLEQVRARRALLGLRTCVPTARAPRLPGMHGRNFYAPRGDGARARGAAALAYCPGIMWRTKRAKAKSIRFWGPVVAGTGRRGDGRRHALSRIVGRRHHRAAHSSASHRPDYRRPANRHGFEGPAAVDTAHKPHAGRGAGLRRIALCPIIDPTRHRPARRAGRQARHRRQTLRHRRVPQFGASLAGIA